MYFVFCLLLFGKFGTIDGETFSLNYIYTALSKPVNLPGIHEFTAMGLLNGKMIDYYDSKDQKKIPKQDWMKDRCEESYWEKGTRSRKSKEQWFRVNIDILMTRMRHNSSDLHVLQWTHGCTVDKLPDGSVKFLTGIDRYSYDGEDFLSFNEDTMQWVAPVDQAVPTKRKWDKVQILNQYTKGYLEKECMDWLMKFIKYEEEQLETRSTDNPPKVYAFAKRSTTPEKVILTCMATGFYPKDIELSILKNGIEEKNELKSTGVRPNHDDTFQIRKSVEIPVADESANYTCRFQHRTLKNPLVETWDGTIYGPNPSSIIGVVVAVALVLVFIIIIMMIVLWRKGLMDNCQKPNGGNWIKEITVDMLDDGTSSCGDSGKGSTEEMPIIGDNGSNDVQQPFLSKGDDGTSSCGDSGKGSTEEMPIIGDNGSNDVQQPFLSKGDYGTSSCGDSGKGSTEEMPIIGGPRSDGALA